MGVPSSPPHTLKDVYGPRGVPENAAHGRGLRESSVVAATFCGVERRYTDAAGCVTPRGERNVAHLDARGVRRIDTS